VHAIITFSYKNWANSVALFSKAFSNELPRGCDEMKAMICVGLSGAALLFLFTVWLAWRNWTPEVYKPVASILVGGLVVLLVTLLTILRSTEEQRSFFSSVVLDERTHLPTTVGHPSFPVPEDAASLQSRITTRHFNIGRLANGEFLPSPNEPYDALAGEFFQYKLLLDFGETAGTTDLQNITVSQDQTGVNRLYLLNRQRMLPPQALQVAGEEVLRWFETNRISHLPTQIDHWNRRGLLLPKGARVRLSSQILETVPERVITISRPGSFDASIRIKCLGSMGRGILPPEIIVDQAEAEHLSSYTMVVTMRAHFDWLTAASPEMPAYKQWISFVFGKIEQFNSDYAVSRLDDHALASGERQGRAN
jgi:hypothetical protein